MNRNPFTTWRAAVLRWLRRGHNNGAELTIVDDLVMCRCDVVPVRERDTGGAMYASPEFLEHVHPALRGRYAQMTDEYEDARPAHEAFMPTLDIKAPRPGHPMCGMWPGGHTWTLDPVEGNEDE